jgi:hypothetical protein
MSKAKQTYVWTGVPVVIKALPIQSTQSFSLTSSSMICRQPSNTRLLRIVLSAKDYITLRVPVDISFNDLYNKVMSKCLRCGRKKSDLMYRIFIWESHDTGRSIGIFNDTTLWDILQASSHHEHTTLYWM